MTNAPDPTPDIWMYRKDRDDLINMAHNSRALHVEEWCLNDSISQLTTNPPECTINHENWVGHVVRVGDRWFIYIRDDNNNDDLLTMKEALKWLEKKPTQAPTHGDYNE